MVNVGLNISIETRGIDSTVQETTVSHVIEDPSDIFANQQLAIPQLEIVTGDNDTTALLDAHTGISEDMGVEDVLRAQKVCPYLGSMSTSEALRTIREPNPAIAIIAERGRQARLAKEKIQKDTSPTPVANTVKSPTTLKENIPTKELNLSSEPTHPETIPPPQNIATTNRMNDRARQSLQNDTVRQAKVATQKIEPVATKKIVHSVHNSLKTKTENKSRPSIVKVKKSAKTNIDRLSVYPSEPLDTIPVPYRATETLQQPTTIPLANKGTLRHPSTEGIKPKINHRKELLEVINPTTTDARVLKTEATAKITQSEKVKVQDVMQIDDPKATSASVVNVITEVEVPYCAEIEENNTERTVSPEATAVYFEIITLIENQGVTEDSAESTYITLGDPETPKDIDPISEPTNQLQILLEEYPQTQERITLQEIKNTANDLPLGETIVQLAIYFSQEIKQTEGLHESVEVKTNTEEMETKIILKEIVIELENLPETEREAGITPEIIQMLLALIEILGYENPRETLLKFVAQNNVDVLLQSITHLHFLSDDSYQEFKKGTAQSLIFSGSANSSTITYIGKMLLEFITPFAYQKI